MIMGNYAKGKGQYDNVDEDAAQNGAGGESGGTPKMPRLRLM